MMNYFCHSIKTARQQKNKMRIIIFVLILAPAFVSNPSYSQKNDILLMVLKKDQVNKTFLFDSSSEKDGLYKSYITYLGPVNANNKVLKIVTQKNIWGSNQHTSGIIYIYDNKNQYVGKYSLGSGFDLPIKIQKSYLIFTNEYKKDCDPNLTTTIDFSMEIPQIIFLKCKGEHGDVYSFPIEKD